MAAGIEPSDRLRAPGGGDKPLIDKPARVCSRRSMSWSIPRLGAIRCRCCAGRRSRSTKLADDLVRQGFEVSARTVLRLLHRLGYSLQANAKVTEGRQHPDRDAQFRYLNDMAAERSSTDGQPVISVDTKKKELVGDLRQRRRASGQPDGRARTGRRARLRRPGPGRVRQSHPVRDLRRGQRRGLGQSSATAPTPPSSRSSPSAAGGTRWAGPGSPTPTRLLITADAGGSNGYRVRAWKVELARLAAETGLRDHGLPLPAGHLEVEPDRAPHVQLHHHELAGPAPDQRAHHHRADLRHHHQHRPHHPSRLRPQLVPNRLKITDAELAAVPLDPHDWHGDWNYTINAQSILA